MPNENHKTAKKIVHLTIQYMGGRGETCHLNCALNPDSDLAFEDFTIGDLFWWNGRKLLVTDLSDYITPDYSDHVYLSEVQRLRVVPEEDTEKEAE